MSLMEFNFKFREKLNILRMKRSFSLLDFQLFDGIPIAIAVFLYDEGKIVWRSLPSVSI